MKQADGVLGAGWLGKTQQIMLERLRKAAEAERCLVARDDRERKALARLVKRGLAISPLPGLFFPANDWAALAPDARLKVVAHGYAQRHPSCVFFGATAALLHGLPVSWERLNALEVRGKNKSWRGPLMSVHFGKSADDTYELADGLKVASMERTLLDCADTFDFPELLALCDAALAKRQMTSIGMEAYLTHRYWHCKGIARLLQAVRLADPRAESAAESFARADCLLAGCQSLEIQVHVPDALAPGRWFRIDLVTAPVVAPSELRGPLACGARVRLEPPLVMCEVDGRIKTTDEKFLRGRTTAAALQDERMRESHLSAYGQPIVRVFAKEARRPGVVSGRIARVQTLGAGNARTVGNNAGDTLPDRPDHPPIRRSYLEEGPDGPQVICEPCPLEELRDEFTRMSWLGWERARMNGSTLSPMPMWEDFDLLEQEWKRLGWYAD